MGSDVGRGHVEGSWWSTLPSDFHYAVGSVKNVGFYLSQSFIDLLLDRCHQRYNKVSLFTERNKMEADKSIFIRQGTNIKHIISTAPCWGYLSPITQCLVKKKNLKFYSDKILYLLHFFFFKFSSH